MKKIEFNLPVVILIGSILSIILGGIERDYNCVLYGLILFCISFLLYNSTRIKKIEKKLNMENDENEKD